MINPEQIQEIITAISRAQWQMNYEQFCELLDFHPSHNYSQEKWQQFQQLNRAINYFDLDSLTKIIQSQPLVNR